MGSTTINLSGLTQSGLKPLNFMIVVDRRRSKALSNRFFDNCAHIGRNLRCKTIHHTREKNHCSVEDPVELIKRMHIPVSKALKVSVLSKSILSDI